MRLDWNDIKARAAIFADEWKNAAYERGDTQTFYNEFFELFGVPRKRVASFEAGINLPAGKRGFLDLFWKGKLLVEQKSAGRDLVAAKKQALDYFPGLKDHELPRYILLSDFQTFELYDLDINADTPTRFRLSELPDHVQAFGFIVGQERRIFRDQDPVNIQASEMMGALHDALDASGYRGHKLERFLVRLLFCLFADDTGIFQPLGLLQDFIMECTSEDGRGVGSKLEELFQTLNTPEAERQRNLDAELVKFPYVNGDLFSEALPIAAFNRDMREKLLNVCSFNWEKVSPAIFGSLFQSVMNKADRRKKGAHYTSERNILKVIEPLFMDALSAEFERLKARRDNGRGKALQEFHSRLGKLTFFDPACGCGNFLVIAYRELRELELLLLRELHPAGQRVTDIGLLTRVNVDQFYGIELEEFPARIAEVAMWMMDHIMNGKLSAAFGEAYARIPLKTSPNIRHGDALEVDWAEVLPPAQCSFVFGNPPFIGQSYQSLAQRAQMARIVQSKRGGSLDYVCAWFLKAGAYVKAASSPSPHADKPVQSAQIGEMVGRAGVGGASPSAERGAPPTLNPSPPQAEGGKAPALPRIAFVSTNSITQGEQVAQVWPLLFERYGLEIAFGHRTFEWMSDARGKAHVHCVIIGLTLREDEPAEKRLFSYEKINGDPKESQHAVLSPYLFGAGGLKNSQLVVRDSSKPISPRTRMMNGPKSTDGGHLIIGPEEYSALLLSEPGVEKFLRPYVGSVEYINGRQRWIFFLRDIEPELLRKMPFVKKCVDAVRSFRSISQKKATRELSLDPTLLEGSNVPSGRFLVIPQVSSERRNYIPIGWMKEPSIPSDKLRYIQTEDILYFAILTSQAHMAWMRAITGRMKSDYMYSVGVVYNTFPWPDTTDKAKDKLRTLAQAVLDARANHPDSTLADLYDPDVMPPDLRRAHKALDDAVDKLYRRDPFASDRERVEHLFMLYEKLTADLVSRAAVVPKKPRRKRLIP